MFLVVPCIDFTELAIIVEGNSRCGVLLSEKVVVTILAVFF